MGTFSDSEQRAMDQESGRQEDAHRRLTSAALEKIKRQVAEHPLLVADNGRLRALLREVHDGDNGDLGNDLADRIASALKVTP